MCATRDLAVGQLRRHELLGSAAVYRVRRWDAATVSVEVVDAPGLRAGEVFKLSRGDVCAMTVPDGDPERHVGWLRSWLRSLPQPTLRSIALVALVFIVADVASMIAGDSFLPGGPLDEVAHLGTAVIILWALGPRVCRPALWPVVLVATVAVDVDHIPDRLGAPWLTAGTPRPYTHSLLTILLVLLLASALRRHRDVLLAVALGLSIHFFRDLAEPGHGVSLLWPVSDRAASLPHAAYGGVIIGCLLVGVGRVRQRVLSPSRRRALVQPTAVATAPPHDSR
jgi:inner membrane protein